MMLINDHNNAVSDQAGLEQDATFKNTQIITMALMIMMILFNDHN